MIDRFADFLAQLTPRERFLISALLLIAVPVAVVFLWILPLGERRETAQRDLSAAVAQQAWVADRVVEKAALAITQRGSGTGPSEPIGISRLEDSLVGSELRSQVSRLANQEAGQVELRFDEVRFSKLSDWLNQISPGWGYELASFRIERGEKDDVVSAQFILRQPEE
ncbi:MAG: type II secretion system protein M [Rhodobacteraceae bacterium]|nr:type II secretion system protein M [Paracoccaceae bacterium]